MKAKINKIVAIAISTWSLNSFAETDMKITTFFEQNPVWVDTTSGVLSGNPDFGISLGISSHTNIGLRASHKDFNGQFTSTGGEINSKWFKSGVKNDSLYLKPFLGYWT